MPKNGRERDDVELQIAQFLNSADWVHEFCSGVTYEQMGVINKIQSQSGGQAGQGCSHV